MLYDTMFDRIPELEHASFAACYIVAHVHFRLVTGAGDDDIVLGPSYAELQIIYTDGMTKGFFYYPLNPTLI